MKIAKSLFLLNIDIWHMVCTIYMSNATTKNINKENIMNAMTSNAITFLTVAIVLIPFIIIVVYKIVLS